ncbi:hypothetical protein AK812_SmicGene48809, partial [Symbiodinium microadriaticum]
MHSECWNRYLRAKTSEVGAFLVSAGADNFDLPEIG